MQLFYSDHFPLPLPDGHRFPMSKYHLLRQRIVESGALAGCELCVPPAATNQQLSLAHTADYIHKVQTGSFSDVELRRIGFPWSKKMVERSRRSTGATIAAAESALEQQLSGNLAGGTHHAFANSGQGYCVFNDVCVAARILQSKHGIRNILVIDCDVHQGNGTASIASQDPSLFTFSMHCDTNYPFKKTNGDLDVALPPGTDDHNYLTALRESLDKIEQMFQPDFIFYLAGADPYEHDRLGKLKISKNGLRKRDEFVFQFCAFRQIPVVFCMAGGYAQDVDQIVDIHFSTVFEAHRCFNNYGQKKLVNPGNF